MKLNEKEVEGMKELKNLESTKSKSAKIEVKLSHRL